MKSTLFILALILASLADAQAQAPAAFSRLGFGARGVALGNALAADSSASPFYNPALAPFATRQNLTASIGQLSLDRDLQFVEFRTPLQRAGIAIGLTHSVVSGIDGRDNNGFHTGDISTSEFAGFLAFGLKFGPRFTGGIGLQFFRSDLFDGLGAVNSIGVDLGMTARVWKDIRVGLVLDDLLARFSWDTSDLFSSGGKSSSDRFPVRVRLGASKLVYHNRVQLLAEYEARFSDVELISSTVDLIGDSPVQFAETERLTLRSDLFRAGVKYAVVEALDIYAGLDRTAGGAGGAFRPAAGFSVEQPVGALGLKLGYAFAREPHGLGSAHYISLRLYLEP
jgi:hypothetical protein